MKTVLILSSDPCAVDLLRNAISAARFDGKVEVLKGTTRLLQRLQEFDLNPPEAVFVDMSGISDGVRLVEWLRLSSRLRRLRVIAMGEESEAMTVFRNAWGSQAVLPKPLRPVAVEHLVASLRLTPVRQQSLSPNDQKGKLLEAIRASKRLRAQQEELLGHVDALRAELKDKKAPFKRTGIGSDHQAA
jgi:DNA-binding response OmpR family regulator